MRDYDGCYHDYRECHKHHVPEDFEKNLTTARKLRQDGFITQEKYAEIVAAITVKYFPAK